MRIIRKVQILVGLALLGGSGVVLADVPAAATAAARDATQIVVIVGDSQLPRNCSEATPERARWLADRASKDGAYQRAGECYLAAGEHALADRAFVKASVQISGDTSRRLAANLNDVKAQAQQQARQMKEAFRRR